LSRATVEAERPPASLPSGGEYSAIVRLLILTGQRRSEVANLSLAEIDFAAKIWTLPASRAKNNRQNSIPLSDAALAILESLPRNGGAAIFEPQSFSKAKKQLDELLPPDMPGWVLHDLRRTAATNLARLGTALPVVERILNHIGGSFAGVAGIYMKFEFSDEKARGLGEIGRILRAVDRFAPSTCRYC
jgi:integrase